MEQKQKVDAAMPLPGGAVIDKERGTVQFPSASPDCPITLTKDQVLQIAEQLDPGMRRQVLDILAE
jgi:hypothetical protein